MSDTTKAREALGFLLQCIDIDRRARTENHEATIRAALDSHNALVAEVERLRGGHYPKLHKGSGVDGEDEEPWMCSVCGKDANHPHNVLRHGHKCKGWDDVRDAGLVSARAELDSLRARLAEWEALRGDVRTVAKFVHRDVTTMRYDVVAKAMRLLAHLNREADRD